MQAFVVTNVKCNNGRPTLEAPLVFWDRQAAYRHYAEGGGDQVPDGHKLESLETRRGGDLICLCIVDIPDRRKYDRAFVLELVRQIQDGEISQSEASRLHGPSQSRISEWMREYASEAAQLPRSRRRV